MSICDTIRLPLNGHIFQYWKHPGAFNRAGLVENHINTDRFLALVSVIIQATFSYGGMELVAM